MDCFHSMMCGTNMAQKAQVNYIVTMAISLPSLLTFVNVWKKERKTLN